MSADSEEAWSAYRRGRAAVVDLETRVHVWRVDLDTSPEQAGEALSVEERDRARRLVRPKDRLRFIAARSTLRLILADVLETMPGSLRLSAGPAGKPFLPDAPGLHFNVSHSDDLAVIAVTRAGEIGIDVEKQRPVKEMDAIARILFTEAERAALLGCPAPARDAVFYRIWTRKEALLKAMGVGVAGLRDPEAILADGTTWILTTLPRLHGYAGALARPRAARDLRLWSWPGTPVEPSGDCRLVPRGGAPSLRSPAPRRRGPRLQASGPERGPPR